MRMRKHRGQPRRATTEEAYAVIPEALQDGSGPTQMASLRQTWVNPKDSRALKMAADYQARQLARARKLRRRRQRLHECGSHSAVTD